MREPILELLWVLSRVSSPPRRHEQLPLGEPATPGAVLTPRVRSGRIRPDASPGSGGSEGRAETMKTSLRSLVGRRRRGVSRALLSAALVAVLASVSGGISLAEHVAPR